MWITSDALQRIRTHVARKRRVYVKVNSPLMLHAILSIQLTLQHPVIFALILHLNKMISLNPHHTDATSLCDLCETVFSLPRCLHSTHIHSPLMLMALDFMGLFYYEGNNTAGLHRNATWQSLFHWEGNNNIDIKGFSLFDTLWNIHSQNQTSYSFQHWQVKLTITLLWWHFLLVISWSPNINCTPHDSRPSIGPHWQHHVFLNTTDAFQAEPVASQIIGQGDSQQSSTEQTHQWNLQWIESELS